MQSKVTDEQVKAAIIAWLLRNGGEVRVSNLEGFRTKLRLQTVPLDRFGQILTMMRNRCMLRLHTYKPGNPYAGMVRVWIPPQRRSA